MRISDDQAGEISVELRAARREELLAFLREKLPDQVAAADDDELRRRLLQGETAGRGWHISGDTGLSLLSLFAALLGQDLHRVPTFRQFFDNPSVTGDDKVKLLVKIWNDKFPQGGG